MRLPTQSRTTVLSISVGLNVLLFLSLVIYMNSCSGPAPTSSSLPGSSSGRLSSLLHKECSSLITEKDCVSRSHCKAVVAHVCGKTDSFFVGCRERLGNETSSSSVSTSNKGGFSGGVCARQPKRSLAYFDTLSAEELSNEWTIDTNCEECFGMKPTLAVIALVWNEMDSLRNALRSWKANGLISYANEFVIYVQELTPEKKREIEEFDGVKVMGTPDNTNIAYALDQLIKATTSDFVLFLEKDWMLIEPFAKVKEQLETGIRLVNEGKADLVKYRSRYDGGHPNYAQAFYQGKEDDVWKSQPNLLCNFYHWIDDPDWRFPDKFVRCNDHPVFFCIDSYYCNWTNNPILFKRSWWKKNFSQLALSLPKNHKHNWEGMMNNAQEVWNNRGFIVGEGNGLFKHVEINEQ